MVVSLKFLTFGNKSTSMRNIRNLSRIRTIIRHSGFRFKNIPSVDFPIPVTVFYRNGQDGMVRWFWPKGNRETALSKFNNGSHTLTWTTALYNLFFAFGLDGFLAHGKLIIYADLPTATCLRHQWKP
jgi:hypothetical protein